jgi:hypothetical protein
VCVARIYSQSLRPRSNSTSLSFLGLFQEQSNTFGLPDRQDLSMVIVRLRQYIKAIKPRETISGQHYIPFTSLHFSKKSRHETIVLFVVSYLRFRAVLVSWFSDCFDGVQFNRFLNRNPTILCHPCAPSCVQTQSGARAYEWVKELAVGGPTTKKRKGEERNRESRPHTECIPRPTERLTLARDAFIATAGDRCVRGYAHEYACCGMGVVSGEFVWVGWTLFVLLSAAAPDDDGGRADGCKDGTANRKGGDPHSLISRKFMRKEGNWFKCLVIILNEGSLVKSNHVSPTNASMYPIEFKPKWICLESASFLILKVPHVCAYSSRIVRPCVHGEISRFRNTQHWWLA